MIADEMKVDKLQTGKKIQSLMEKNGDSVQGLSQRIGLSKSCLLYTSHLTRAGFRQSISSGRAGKFPVR